MLFAKNGTGVRCHVPFSVYAEKLPVTAFLFYHDTGLKIIFLYLDNAA